jgi:hypothetical protein
MLISGTLSYLPWGAPAPLEQLTAGALALSSVATDKDGPFRAFRF